MNITFITTLVFAALLVSCSNTVPPVNDNTTNTTTVPEAHSFELPTPDSLAFVGTIRCKTGKVSKICGYGAYLRDATVHKIIPAFSPSFPKNDSPLCYIGVHEYGKSGELINSISIGWLPLGSGVYFLQRVFGQNVKKIPTATYYDSNGGCSDKNQYVLDTTHQSFVKVVSYDSVSKEIKLRFDLYFQLEKINVPGDYPKYLHFGDGVLLAKTAN